MHIVARHLPLQIADGIRKLEPLPVTATRLMHALRDPDVSLAEVAQIIEYDETVAAEVLRLSATVEFAGRMQAQTIQQAVLRIGAERLLNLVLGQYLQTLQTDGPKASAAEDRLWLHSAATEIAVGALWQENPALTLPPLVSTAALLHDIGKLLMLRYLADDYLEQVTYFDTPSMTRIDMERRVFRTDHAEVGAALARRWRFPSEIVEAIASHHNEGRSGTPLVDIVMAGNQVAKVVGAADSLDPVTPLHVGGCITRLRLPRGGFRRACHVTRRQITDLCHRAALPPPPPDASAQPLSA